MVRPPTRSTRPDTLVPYRTPCRSVASLSPAWMRRNGIRPGDRVRVSTRRGAVELVARADGAVADGMVFMAFCFAEAAANRLTNPQLDPYGKIPEFKRSEEHTSELQSLMRNSYAVFCFQTKTH